MIEITELKKKFGRFEALKGINLTFGKGEVVAVMGPNGSGKTTMLKSITGLVIPSSGSIKVQGINIKNNWQYRENIGYMPQVARYPENLKVRELIDMVKDIRNSAGKTDEELIELLEVEKMYEKTMGSLSGGMRQRVNAVLAFLFNQEIIILDEPTASLDPVSAEVIKNKIIREKDKGKLVIVTSHIISEVEEVAERLVFMLEGLVHIDSTVHEVKADTSENKLSKAIAKVMAGYANR